MKGFIKTLEAVLAAIMLLSVAFYFYSTPQDDFSNIARTGEACINELNNQGLLRYYGSNNMEIDLKNAMDSCLPDILDYDVKICMSDNCKPSKTTSENVYTVDYVITGEDSIQPIIVRLWVWPKI